MKEFNFNQFNCKLKTVLYLLIFLGYLDSDALLQQQMKLIMAFPSNHEQWLSAQS